MIKSIEIDHQVMPAGFALRPATPADIPAIVDILNIYDRQFTGWETHTVELVEKDWDNPKFDMTHSARVAVETATGRVVGYASVWDTEPMPVANWVSCSVHPDFMGRGLGTALHQWAAVRLQEALGRVPEDVQVAYHCGARGEDKAAQALFDSLGMTKARYFWRMVIDLTPNRAIPEPALPVGFVIRPWAEVQDRIPLLQVMQAADEAFQDHWGHVDQPLDEMIVEWQHWLDSTPDMGPDVWFLLLEEATGEIAGVSLCRRKSRNEPRWAYLNTLGVRRAYRHRGLALALLHYTFRFFQQAGLERVELHVDASSLTGATRLYEKAGMVVDEEDVGYIQILRHGRDLSTQTL
ncbi:MAG: GNAT family N-acetyltransferase [Anaerolineales bacterium]|nr:GNAT family N-acetyltransferase [Anaerolineales bacterium]